MRRQKRPSLREGGAEDASEKDPAQSADTLRTDADMAAADSAQKHETADMGPSDTSPPDTAAAKDTDRDTAAMNGPDPDTGAVKPSASDTGAAKSPDTGAASAERAACLSEAEEAAQGSAAVKAPRRKKCVRAIVAVILALIVAAAGFTAGWLGSRYSVDPRLRELEWLLNKLEEEHYQYVDMDAVYEELYDAAMPDIFSRYYTPEEYARILAESEGHNEGVGITLLTDGTSVRIWAVVENSPAQEAGLQKGMYVLGYGTPDGDVLTGTGSAITAFMQAQEGDFVLYASFDPDAAADASTAYTLALSAYEAAYVVYRDSETSYAFRGETASLTETHEPLAGLDAATAYLRLDSFDGNCAAEFAACLAVKKARGRTNLILDLRGNGGGYLSDLQSIASHLLRNAQGENPLVAYAQFRDGTRRNYYATGNDFSAFFSADARISVLADENSASASECLIGALIDYGTIGYSDLYLRRAEGAEHYSTYGKGVMQSTYRSPSGGAFQLTVARIYWPEGKCIHDRGVTDEDGAVGITAPFLHGEEDSFLQQAVAAICGAQA